MTASASLLNTVWGRPAPAAALPSDQAFEIRFEASDGKTLIATVAPASEHCLYWETVRFAAKDPFFGEVDVYSRPVQATLALERATNVTASLSVAVSDQGLNQRLGSCYPPTQAEFPLRPPDMR